MFVNTLEIKNLRSFTHLKINFSSNINIITGPNNSGKSSIIKSLYKLQNLPTLNRSDIRTNEHSYHILVEMSDVHENEKILFKNASGFLLPQIEKAHIILESFTSFEERHQIEVSGKGVIEMSLDNFFNVGSTGNFSFAKFLGFPNSEDKDNFIYPFFAKRKSTHYSSQINRDTTFSVLDNFQNLPAKIQKVTSHPATETKFDNLCKEILGFKIRIIPGEGNESKIGMYSGLANKNLPIPLESMGDGVANIIGLITILLTEDRKLFLIEELENDIHPLALKKLLNLIIEKSQSNQFIISTHSNIILKYLGSLERSKIFFTEVEYIETSNLFTSSITELANSSEERLRILGLLGYDLFDYGFYNSYLILEESSAETIIRDFIIPNFFPDLQYRLRTIAANGTSDLIPKFNDLHRLFMYLHKTEVYKSKAWVIADGESSGIDYINKLKEKFPSWDASHFKNFKESDFELYYPVRFQEEAKNILKIKDDRKKIEQKKELLLKVIKWCSENKEEAVREFADSAKEVIDKIKEIGEKAK